jgi:hypothetical protein
MQRLFWLTVVVVFNLGLGLVLSCGDDDDDDSGDDDTDTDDDDNDDNDNNDDDAVWLDPATGLMWEAELVNEPLSWAEAAAYCEGLSLGGFDDWQLPAIWELRTLIRGCDATETGGDCGVTDGCLDDGDCWNDPCDGCTEYGGPAAGGCYWVDEISGLCVSVWSSSGVEGHTELAWYIIAAYGSVWNVEKTNDLVAARCVRRPE